MGLIDRNARKSAGSKRKWTYSEDMFLIQNNKEMTNKELAAELGTHSEGSVLYRVSKLASGKLGNDQIDSIEQLAAYHRNRGTFDGETEEVEAFEGDE